MAGIMNARRDATNSQILYIRSFMVDRTHRALQKTLQTLDIQTAATTAVIQYKDCFSRQLFHEAKTPLQILTGLTPVVKFNNINDQQMFSIAIKMLSNLIMDMSIVSDSINVNECLNPLLTT